MALTVPLAGTGAASETRAGAASVPIVFGGTSGLSLFGGNVQQKVLRAIAAGASVHDSTAAIKEAKKAVDDPGGVFAETIDATKIQPVFEAVMAAIRTRPATDAATLTPAHRAAATAIGADPVLTVTAQNAIANTADSLPPCLAWTASIDASLLDRAARAVKKQAELALLPSSSQSTARLDGIDARLRTLEERVAKLESPS